jgi:DNA-binding PadR family transcriptional regulator
MTEKIDVSPDLEREVLVAVAMANGSYGSDIISKIADEYKPSKSSAYRTLRQLERKGLVNVVPSRLRYTYTVTKEGVHRLQEDEEALRFAAQRCIEAFHASVDSVN